MTPPQVSRSGVPARRAMALIAFLVAATLGSAVPASAHVTLTLLRIPADTAMQLAFRAPIEREGTTNVKIESLVPPEFTVQRCIELTGWTCTLETVPDGTVMTWQALTVGTPNDLRFEFDVVTPSTPGLYRMPTIQTYSDGAESEWIAEDEPNPAPSVEVEHDIEPEEAPEPTPDPPANEPAASEPPGGHEPTSEGGPASDGPTADPSDGGPASGQGPDDGQGPTEPGASEPDAGRPDQTGSGTSSTAGTGEAQAGGTATSGGQPDGQTSSGALLLVIGGGVALGGAAMFLLARRRGAI